MNTNTSNSQGFRNLNSQSSVSSSQRQVITSSTTREVAQTGINGDGGMDYNLVYRSMQFPQQISFDQLVQTKEVLQELLREFKDKDGRVVFEPYKKQEYSKRLLLLENQIDGIMRQSLLYSGRGTDGSVRTIDYLTLINQKQNQVVQLQKKITYLEAQLRMRDQRQVELETELQRRFASIKAKNDQIQRLKNSSRSYADAGKSQPEVVNNLIKSLVSKLQELSRRGGSVAQLQSEVESWILGLPNDSALKRKLRSADEDWLQGKYKKYISYLTAEAGGMLNNMTKMYTTQIDTLKSRGTAIDYDNRILDLVGQQIIPRNLLPTQEVLMSHQVTSRDVKSSNITSLTTIINSNAVMTSSGYINGVRKVIQVPVQDTRTKALIHKLASQMKRLYTKYPKLASQISPQLSQYFSQQIIDVIEVDQLDRLVEIVKYRPQIVRTENVYAYSSEKSRKVQFHLRVLIKALLQQMQKMKRRTGIQPEIDEGVIGMINQQIMDVVNVDDILRVYRVVPKIVQVERIVQQTVQKIVPVPHFVAIQSRHTDIVPLKQVQVVKDTVNVPIQVPKIETLIHEKLVLKPEYRQKVVVSTALEQNRFETVTQIPKVRNVEKVVGLMQDQAKIVEVPGPEKIVQLVRQIEKTLIKQKIVPVEKIIQQIVEVPKIIQKIVTVIQQVPKIIQVQKIVQKIVPVTQYVQNQRVQNFVVEKPIQVICYVQKIVPVERIIQRVVTHPQIVQKIVPVIKRQEVIKTVQIIKQVPIYHTEIKVVQRIKEVPMEARTVEVAKSVDRIVEVPMIHEKIRVQTEYRKQPVIQKQQQIIREPVHVEVPVVLFEERILQVPKPEVHVVKQEIPRDIIKEKIVPFETVRQQLIPAPCIIQKIIEKIVQVPRIVEIERIVQKIVPVPRIIQKIVEVEKIVEKIVQKIIYQTELRPVEYITEVPIEVQRIKTIEIPQYVRERVEVPHYIDRDRIIINETKTESVRVQHIEQPPRVVIERKQVPIQIVIEKLVPLKVEDHIYVELKEQIIVPVEVPVPTTLIQQKLVPVEHIIPVIQQVDRVRDRIVEVKVEMPGRVQTKDRLVQKLFVQKDVKVVRDEIPYYNDKIIEVQRFTQKIVPVQRVIKQVMQVPFMVQKIVAQMTTINNIQQIQKIVQVPIRTQQLVTVDRIVPKIVTLNKAFAQIVDKLHEFPRLAQEMQKVNNEIQMIVPEQHSTTDVRQTEVYVQKAVIEEKMKQVDKYINVINQSLKIAERIIERPTEPIIITEQKILQVPVIVQKLAERIVIMPQIVQILKYVHEITDNESLGVALSGQMGIEEAEYQRLGKSVNGELARLRSLLMDLKRNPEYKGQVTVIDTFLSEFNKFLAYPRIRQVMTQKVVQSVVEKDKIVKVPVRSSDDERRGLASAVLIDKLVMEIKKLRQTNPNPSYRIDQDLIQIFGEQLDPISSKYGNNYNQLLDEYSKSIYSRFNMHGTWTLDHQRMLREFIDERFQLANRVKKANKDSVKYKQLYSGTIQKYNRQKFNNEEVRNKFMDLQKYVREILVIIIDMGMKRVLEEKLNILEQAIFGYASGADTITYQLKQMSDMDKERANRYVREKDALIAQLRITIQNLKRELERRGHTQVQGQLVYGNCNMHTQIIGDMQAELDELRRYRAMYGSAGNINTSSQKTITTERVMTGAADHSQCQNQINRLKSELARSKQEITRITTQITRLRQVQIQHRGCAHRIRQLEERLKIITEESERYKKELFQYRSVKQTKRTIGSGSINTPNRGDMRTDVMSDSYGTQYMNYVRDDSDGGGSSGIRGSRADLYQRNVFRSGGNPGTTGESLGVGIDRGGSGSVSGVVGGTGGMGSSGTVATSGGGISGGNVSGGYVQQRSTNYLTDSRGSGASGSVSGGQLSSKSSRTGGEGQAYNYQQVYQKEYSARGSVAQSSEVKDQKFIRNVDSDQSGSGSKLYGTSTQQIIQRTTYKRETREQIP